MKKILPILIIGILVLGGAGATSIFNYEIKNDKEINRVKFSAQVEISKEDEYLNLNFEGTNSWLAEPGKPLLPIYVQTFEFSKNAKIKGVSCEYSTVEEKRISGVITPCPEIQTNENIKQLSKESQIIENNEIYESESLFPDSWYDYSIRCGLNREEIPTTFVTVVLYPVRYSPAKNTLYYFSEADIQIDYKETDRETTTSTIESYDLVIIAPSLFEEDLQPLVDHKIAHGTNTLLKTTEAIYSEYEGRDTPEQIKYFILDALESYEIKYVLLVGGLNSYLYAKDRDDINHGSSAWHLPVRYANIRHTDEKSCISDLYFGDIYRYNEETEEWEFEDWDSSGDGKFAYVSPSPNRDTLDLVPDLYYGRLACRNNREVQIMVDKIINYESTPPEQKPWFKRMIGVGGMTFDYYEGKPDGEWSCDVAMEQMGDLIDEEVRVYASHKGTNEPTIPEDVIPSMSEGAGYVFFQGHGDSVKWNTHPIDDPNEWIGATMVYDFFKCTNQEKLPIVIVGGCHNALFNISILSILFGHFRESTHNYYWTKTLSPFCFCWGMCVVKRGGAIASTGCTGYGFASPTPLNHSGGLEVGFFTEIGQNGADTLGAAHSGSIREFMSRTRITGNEYFCITIWQLFGDPSLKLGGYPSS